ncbi:MAG: hypothetical protein GTO33_14940, partial [Acidobacteria bacterium]|nr:hypothetical protein [Acidobacteriota bacterium]NIO60589.1 hypothetical protein [Acidobacteriota bacterium]NIT12253.1 hypothetical protein [Acidobacteriota bacterium]
AVAAATIAALAFFGLWYARPQAPTRFATVSVLPPAGTTLSPREGLAISPDGTKIAFAAVDESGESKLYIRALDDVEPREVEGSAGGVYPFWSPDSAHVAFFVDEKLKRVTSAGVAPQTICDAPGSRGGAWGPDGVIVFSRGAGSGRGALFQVAAGGGDAEPLTTLGEADFSHRWPSFLPGGKRVLFVRQTGEGNVEGDESTLEVVDLESRETTRILRANSSLQYTRSGHLLYWREGIVLAHPFDPDRLQLTGDPIPLMRNVAYSNAELAQFSASGEGTLIFHSGVAGGTQLRWYAEDGSPLDLVGRLATGLWTPKLSPDETKVAYSVQGDIWVMDLARGTETRLTFTEYNMNPIWSPDGEWIYFASNRRPWG